MTEIVVCVYSYFHKEDRVRTDLTMPLLLLITLYNVSRIFIEDVTS